MGLARAARRLGGSAQVAGEQHQYRGHYVQPGGRAARRAQPNEQRHIGQPVAELVEHLAPRLRNPHAEATSGVDLQVPAITAYLERHGLTLQGSEVVDIGSWQGTSSHPIGVRLSPLQIHVAGSDHVTLESFWQGKKCLAAWEQDAP